MPIVRYSIFLLLILPGLAWTAGTDVDPSARFTEQDNGYNEALEAPWVEIETRVQGGPKDTDLSEIEIEHLPSAMSLYADLQNLSVDERDHVTRLWLVVRSDSGAYNGSYEGFRCATGEYKVYAYFNPRRSTPLRVIKLPRWRPIRPTGYRNELAREVLCSGTNPRDPHSIRVRPLHQAGDYRSPYE